VTRSRPVLAPQSTSDGLVEQARPLTGREKSDCAEAGLRLSLTKPGCRFALKTPSFWATRALAP
jgi:hypothetical protein